MIISENYTPITVIDFSVYLCLDPIHMYNSKEGGGGRLCQTCNAMLQESSTRILMKGNLSVLVLG